MTKRVWHKGPPPHLGWWNASIRNDPNCWRWWDGKRWSLTAYDSWPLALVTQHAKRPATQDIQKLIKWADYWPKNARVPRVKP